MGSGITLWGRNDDPGSLEAVAFLKQHGFAADRVLDIDRQPPTAGERHRILSGGVPPDRLMLEPLPAPILLTPKGALVGFRERLWRQFLEVDTLHDA